MPRIAEEEDGSATGVEELGEEGMGNGSVTKGSSALNVLKHSVHCNLEMKLP